MKNLFTRCMLGLLAVNGALFAATEKAGARRILHTCSIEVASGKCVCDHTIVPECDPQGEIIPQCQTQCAIH